MGTIARMPLEGGGSILVETSSVSDGPVKAGRLGDAIQDLPNDLDKILAPVTDAARAILGQLRKAAPDEAGVEFGLDLSAQAGAVITKTTASCHLKVTLTWRSGDHGQPSAAA